MAKRFWDPSLQPDAQNVPYSDLLHSIADWHEQSHAMRNGDGDGGTPHLSEIDLDANSSVDLEAELGAVGGDDDGDDDGDGAMPVGEDRDGDGDGNGNGNENGNGSAPSGTFRRRRAVIASDSDGSTGSSGSRRKRARLHGPHPPAPAPVPGGPANALVDYASEFDPLSDVDVGGVGGSEGTGAGVAPPAAALRQFGGGAGARRSSPLDSTNYVTVQEILGTGEDDDDLADSSCDEIEAEEGEEEEGGAGDDDDDDNESDPFGASDRRGGSRYEDDALRELMSIPSSGGGAAGAGGGGTGRPPDPVHPPGRARRRVPCFACSYGKRSEAPTDRSKVAKMMRMIDEQRGQVHNRDLARMIHTMFKKEIYLPLSREKRPPMWRTWHVLEHIEKHTREPRAFLDHSLTLLFGHFEALNRMAYWKTEDDGSGAPAKILVHDKNMKLMLDMHRRIMECYLKDPKAMNYYNNASTFDMERAGSSCNMNKRWRTGPPAPPPGR